MREINGISQNIRLKRGVAVLLCFVMILQITLGNILPVMADPVKSGGINLNPIDMTEKGQPEGFFESIKLGGLNSVTGSNEIHMTVDAKVNHEMLWVVLEELIDDDEILSEPEFKVVGGNVEGVYYKEYKDYLNAQVDLLEPLMFSWTYNDIFDTETGSYTMDIITDKGEKIGTYSFEEKKGVPTFSVTLDRFLYYRKDISFHLSFDLSLSEYYKPGTIIEVEQINEDIDLMVTIGDGELPEVHNSMYELKKRIGEKADSDRNINFYINAKASPSDAIASGSNSDTSEQKASPSSAKSRTNWSDAEEMADLSGKIIIDTISSDLEISDVWVKVATGSDAALGDDWVNAKNIGKLTTDENKVVYEIPDDLGYIKEVELWIETRLSDEIYNKYLLSEFEFDKKYYNKATLKGSEDELLTVSNVVEATIKMEKLLSKNGKIIDPAEGKIEWTVTANANFGAGSNVDAWVIDHIEDIDGTHYYDGESKIIIKDVNAKGDEEAFDIVLIEGNVPYEELNSVTMLKDVLGEDKPKPNEVYVYTYNTEDNKKDAVLLIPLSPKYINTSVDIVYETNISNEILDVWLDSNLNELKITMKNEAKAIWRWPNGSGIGNGEEGSVDVSKEVIGNYNLLSKQAASKDGNKVAWKFEINQIGGELTDVVFWDDFDSQHQNLVLWNIYNENNGSNMPAVILTNIYDGNELQEEVPFVANEPENPDERYYTLSEDQGIVTFKMYLGDVGKEEHYKFYLDVIAVDSQGQEGNAGIIGIENKAHLSGSIGGKEFEKSKTAWTNVNSTVLKKTAIAADGKNGYYNYEDHSVKWRIEVNPGHNVMLPLIQLVDNLPEGTTLAEVTRIEKFFTEEGKDPMQFDKTNNDEKWIASDGETIIISKETEQKKSNYFEEKIAELEILTFCMLDEDEKEISSDAKYIFEFTALVDEVYRDIYTKETMLNTVELYSDDMLVARDKAPNKRIPDIMIKNGKEYHDYTSKEGVYQYPYYDENGDIKIMDMQAAVITWEIFVNRTNKTLVNATIKDTVKDFFELVPASFKIEQVSLMPDGEVNEDTAETLENLKFIPEVLEGQESYFIDETGFYLSIPEEYSDKTLRITFDTILIDDANAEDMKNTVELKYDDGKASVTSPESEIFKDFSVKSYAKASGVYYIGIRKVSANQSDDGKFPLQGAKFTLAEQKLKQDSDDRMDFESWEDTGKEKTKVSNKKGNINFLFLKPDTMYKLTETEGPDGYETLFDTEWYFVPHKENETFPEDVIYIDKEENDTDYNWIEIKNNLLEGVGRFEFWKQDANGKGLEGVTFRITETNNDLWFKEVISGDDGKVVIDNLDPTKPTTSYTVREIETLDGYILSSKEFYLTVEYVEGEGYVTKLNDPNHVFLQEENGEKRFVNKLITPRLSFSKIDQNGNAITESIMNVNFKVTPQNVIAETPSDAFYAEKTGNKFTIDFSDGYGTYILEEEEIIADGEESKLKPGAQLAKYKLTVENNGVNNTKITIFDENNSGQKVAEKGIVHGENASPLFDFTSTFKVVNELKHGFVQIDKVAADKNKNELEIYDDVKLAGAKFEIREKEGNKLVVTLTTDENGQFVIKNGTDGTLYYDTEFCTWENKKEALIVGVEYVLQEKMTDDLFEKDENRYSFTLKEHNEIRQVSSNGNSFPNTIKRGDVELQKYDNMNEDYTLKGAEFVVWAKTIDNKLIRAAQIKEGEAESGIYYLWPLDSKEVVKNNKGIPYLYERNNKYYLLEGTYWLEETVAPAGYQKPDAEEKWQFKIENGETSKLDFDGRKITNVLREADVTVKKLVEKLYVPEEFEWTETSGSFKFKLTGTMDNELAIAEQIVETDEDGIAVFEDVPLGTYKIEEILDENSIYRDPASISVAIRIKKGSNPEEIEVVYGENESIVPPTIYNYRKRGSLSGKKMTEKRTWFDGWQPLAGATFELFEKEAFDDNQGVGSVMTCITKENGVINFENVPAGNYYLIETKVPQGYLANDLIVLVEIEDGKETTKGIPGKFIHGKWESDLSSINLGMFKNIPIKGAVQLTKIDEETKDYLDDAIFTVYAKEGTKEVEVCDLVYNKAGIYQLPNPLLLDATTVNWNYFTYLDEEKKVPSLYYGDYVLKETKAPAGYELDLNSYEFKIEDNGETVIIENSLDDNSLFSNVPVKGSIIIEKKAEVIDASLDGKLVEGEGFKFRIYGKTYAGKEIEEYLTGDDITGADEAEFIKDGDTHGIYVTTGADGVVSINGVPLPLEKYYVQEVENGVITEAYIVDSVEREVVLAENKLLRQFHGLIPEASMVQKIDVENYLKRGVIKGTKTTLNGKGLVGATIGLFSEGTKEFTEKNLYLGQQVVTDNDGIFSFTDIPYGDYLVAELKPPKGYYLNRDTVYMVSVTEHGTVIETGYLLENEIITAEETEIIIVNKKKTGGGGGTDPTKPGGPGESTSTSESTDQTEPETTTRPEIPTIGPDPENPGKPEIPPGTIVEIPDPENPLGPPLIKEPWNPDREFPELPSGTYELIAYDDEGVPLGSFLLTIDDEGVPMAIAKAGDFSISNAALVMIMVVALAGAGIVWRRKKEYYE